MKFLDVKEKTGNGLEKLPESLDIAQRRGGPKFFTDVWQDPWCEIPNDFDRCDGIESLLLEEVMYVQNHRFACGMKSVRSV
jgi:hypothetical protein